MVETRDSVFYFQNFHLIKLIQRTLMRPTQDILETKELSKKKLMLNTWVQGEEKRGKGVRR